VTIQLWITAKKDSGQAGMTRSGFANFPVIDPKIPPLTLTLSPKGRGDRISPPLPRGEGTKGRVTFSCSFVSHWLMSIPAIPNAFGRSGIFPKARYQPVTESLRKKPLCLSFRIFTRNIPANFQWRGMPYFFVVLANCPVRRKSSHPCNSPD
jgi:hypothetical protein